MGDLKLFDFVVVGGGIAGISAIEQICLQIPESTVLLLTASAFVRVATAKLRITSHIEELQIQEEAVKDFHKRYPNVTVMIAKLETIYSVSHSIKTTTGTTYGYRKICICSGSIPKLVNFDSPNIIGLRDTDSAVDLKQRLEKSNRVCVLGNGGIATELIYELRNIDVIWVIRDKYIASAFVDSGAAEFLMNCADADRTGDQHSKDLRYTTSYIATGTGKDVPGCALGPNWHSNLELTGALAKKNLTIEFQTFIKDVNEKKPDSCQEMDEWPVYVTLNNGKIFGCDFVVSATGVSPSIPEIKEGTPFELGKDGGMLVNQSMESSVQDIYAAGDVCTVNWDVAFHWFQMRLWSQARPMGSYAGMCMAASFLKEAPPPLDFSFELFTHVTRFFGFRVVLLGLFNGQKLEGRYEALVRVTKGVEYLKLVVQDGKLHGAVLIGDTEMEETFENLILNQLDISQYGENLLNPDIDIEDYFD